MSHLFDLDRAFAVLSAERERNARTDALLTCQTTAELADYLRTERAALIARLHASTLHASTLHASTLHASETYYGAAGREASPGGVAMAKEFSDLMDAVIVRMYGLACARVGASPEKLAVAIVATGGYGRRELSPFSDVDITFIPQRDNDLISDRVIREMFTQVMDICMARCQIEVGYAYRLLDDCASLDHQTTSGLLDARLITGNDRLFIQFEHSFWMGFNATEFIFTKIQEREKALAKWGTTPRVVEPQLKEGPGGLRDLHTAIWLAQAGGQLDAARMRGDRAFTALVKEGYLTPEEAARLALAKERLFQVRNALHAAVGEKRDLLVITRQEEVGALLGYGAEMRGEEPGEVRPGQTPPVERFMGELYPDLATIRRLCDQIIRRVSNSRLILGIGLDCRRRQIVPANEALESDDPTWLLWACELAQKYDLQWSEKLERAAINLLEMNPVLPDPKSAAEIFTRILVSVGRVYPTLQKMSDRGILSWFLPEFGKLLDLIPYDPSHDYTVGQHTLYVVRHLEALGGTAAGDDYVEMRRVLDDLPNPEQLMLAVLLHDSGKAYPGRPHPEVGVDIVEKVCRRLNWTREATANVQFLVRHHLLMAETSRLRDLNMDETIRDFTQTVQDRDRLNMLYLLTYADTRSVGEGVWTQVKGRFLRELWQRAAMALSEEEPGGWDDAAIARARRRLMKDLSLANLPENEVSEHIQAMPPNYLLNQAMTDIALHIEFVRRVRAGEIVVDFQEERDAAYSVLTVCTLDDPTPGLLAKIAGALYAADLEVHNAQVVTRITKQDRIALDTLWVDFRGRPLSPGKKREVTGSLQAVLRGERTVGELLEKRTSLAKGRDKGKPGRRGSSGLSVQEVRSDVADALTFIEVTGPEVKSALYLGADSLSRLGWDIQSAKVSAWKGEARASFYVAGLAGISEQEVIQAFAGIVTSGR